MALTFCIIDDETEVCDLFRLFFEARGHRCLVAHNGEEGLALAREAQPAAIFLDVAMPRMNGFQVLAELKKNDQTRTIPVLLMTALTQNTNLSNDEWAKSTGADAFLQKPFELDELLDAVERLTGVRI